jgi:manganese/iron transport system permease protein
VATVSSLLGVYLSFFIDSAPAPTIVLLMTAAFILAFLFSPNRGGTRLAPEELALRTAGTESSATG